jgi:hypothetical protein
MKMDAVTSRFKNARLEKRVLLAAWSGGRVFPANKQTVSKRQTSVTWSNPKIATPMFI